LYTCFVIEPAIYSGLINNEGAAVSLGTILLIVLVLLLLGALPAWPYSTGWGYYPSGGLGLLLIVLVILVVTGRV